MLDVPFTAAPLQISQQGSDDGRYSLINRLIAFFDAHALTALHASHPAAAVEDIDFLIRLAAAAADQPASLMAGVIATGMAHPPLGLVHEAARLGAFDESQWARCDALLARLRPGELPVAALRHETSSHLETLVKTWHHRSHLREAPEWEIGDYGEELIPSLKAHAFHHRPQGFRDLGLARMLRAQADFAQPDGSQWRRAVTFRDLREVVAREKQFEDAGFRSSDEFMGLPNPPEQIIWTTLSIIIGKSLKLETEIALARHAIALERHRLRHGDHPESLAGLQADLLDRLPSDPMSDLRLHYQPQPPGGFILWSSGVDGIDNLATGDDLVWRRP